MAVKKNTTIPLYTIDGKSEGTLDAPKEIFEVKASDRLLAQYVRVYLANQRQGTNKTKTRSEINASTRKIYKQKGTGRARHGAKSAPIFVGGGTAHGPKLRSYSLKMNKKQKKKALLYSLSLKHTLKNVFGLDGVEKLAGKTKETAGMLKSFASDTKKPRKILFVFAFDETKSSLRGVDNVVGVSTVNARLLNAYDVISNEIVVFTKKGLEDFMNIKKLTQDK